jgi:hypothetical protein
MSMRRTILAKGSAQALALAFALACGCGPIGGTGGTVTPDGKGPIGEQAPQGAADDRSMGALQRKLENFRGKKGQIMNASTRDPAVCEELCSLASDICEVQEKLCDLADEHPGDEQYQNLCREAHNECREAQSSCVRCVESNK